MFTTLMTLSRRCAAFMCVDLKRLASEKILKKQHETVSSFYFVLQRNLTDFFKPIVCLLWSESMDELVNMVCFPPLVRFLFT